MLCLKQLSLKSSDPGPTVRYSAVCVSSGKSLSGHSPAVPERALSSASFTKGLFYEFFIK